MSETPRYSLDLYSIFNAEPPTEEQTEPQQESIISRPTGQQATPDAEQEGYSPYGFLPTMAELIDAEYPQGLSRATLPTMDRFSVQQEELNAYLTPLQEALQTRPVGDTETVRPLMRPLAPLESARPVMNPDREAEEVEPVETATEEVATTEAATEATTTPTTSTTFATITKGGSSTTVDTTTPLTQGFDSLTESEGTNIHLDGRSYVTLPHGIVPDKDTVKKADGTVFDPRGSHGLSKADLAGVDYSGATKYGISRSSYDSDEAWAKAVYAEFGQRTATEYGTGFAELTDEAKQAAYDMAWNAGIGAAGWSSVKTMLQEAGKDESEQTTDNLIGFTTNFKSGTDYPRGLLKRRLQTYNLVAKDGESASTITTSAIMADGQRTGTKYEIKTSDGTILKTWEKPDTDEKLGDLTVG
ncbi:MAG: hypothetical protein GY820_10840 [Gammaproteobacteria bacterium]|nr:hypothetical protein [Gammaproteobacteria bacterium]